MKPYTCTALRIPHMEKIEIETLEFDNELYWETGKLYPRPLYELRFIEISNKGRINPDYNQSQ